MGLFDGYEPFSNESGASFMSVSSMGITFSKAVVTKLGTPKNVVFWINQEKRMVIITPGAEDDLTFTFRFAGEQDPVGGVLLNRRNLRRKICELLGFADINIEKTIYIDGEYYADENAFQFDTKKGYTK